jgi:hypothetical protein
MKKVLNSIIKLLWICILMYLTNCENERDTKSRGKINSVDPVKYNVVNSSDENETTQNEEDKTSILNTIKSNIYVNNENGFETFLSFKEGYDDHTGVMTLSQTNCRYIFNIKIMGNEIDATFFQSTCGNNSSSTTLYYNQEENSLSMNINGQDFTFYPEF